MNGSERVVTIYIQPFTFSFERNFVYEEHGKWIADHWHYTVYLGTMYILVIFSTKALMKHRTPFDLRKPLAIWSSGLALFAFLGTLRTLPEFLYMLKNHGFISTVCDPGFHHGVTGFWVWLFVLSKIPELGDTLFIVLRKQKLPFLHWYHHLTVLTFTWYAYRIESAPPRYYVWTNFLVHSVMYTYYALRAFGYRLPRPLAMVITISQTLQMVIGFSVTVYGYYLQSKGKYCPLPTTTAKAAVLIYASYFVLFLYFFLTSYFGGAKSQSRNQLLSEHKKGK